MSKPGRMSPTRCLLVALLVSLLLSAVAAGLWAWRLLNPLDALDNFAYDRWMLQRNQHVPVDGFKASYPQLVLIAVDDASLHKLGQWPWPHATMAKLLRNLKRAGARVVACDIVFDRRPQEDDGALADALQQLPACVLATLYRTTSTDTPQVDRPLDWLWPRLPPQFHAGAVGIAWDRDGVIRHARLAVPLPDRDPLPALSLAAWCAFSGRDGPQQVGEDAIQVGDVRIPARQGEIRIDWPIPDLKKFEVAQGYRELFPLSEVVPAATALELPPDLAHEVFNDRIVLIGATAQALRDSKPTPLGDMPGLVIHANLIVSLLAGRFLVEWPHAAQLGVFVLSAMLLGTFMGRRAHPLFALLFGIGLYAAWWCAARWLFIEHNVVAGIAAPTMNGAVFTVLLAWQTLMETREKAQVRRIFGEYLSPAVVETLVSARRLGRLGLEGKREKVTVFFADVRGFTSMSESLPAEEVVRMLNEYFAAVGEIAVRHGGYIDKYGGDSIMIVYSAPFPHADDALRAVRAADEMQKKVESLNRIWSSAGRPTLRVGMGLDTGEVVLGNIGSALKREYTVIGDHVNVAARLCSAAEGGQILMSAETWNDVRVADVHEELEARPLPPLRVKGKSQPLEVYALATAQRCNTPAGKEA